MAADADGSQPPQQKGEDKQKGDDSQQQDQNDDEKLQQYPDVPDREEPQLDPTGKRPQRTVEQQEKQTNLVKANRREKGLDSNRSRSQSRRARRNRVEKDMRDGKYMNTNSLPALEEADANGELKAMQPFERIGPDSTSMDGPVTMARAMRGEIPMRGAHPGQPYIEKDKSKLDDTDGLSLSIEANLDIEIELKASIRGDLTLSLMA
ncbi:hypothetical protein K461DRAFT_309726 [Myriangium duriaei CBS 260.36]|uniref:Uncharacterized protein n=1 Tax=Myriangium duriaei CBS 260.36 TaxID=1168546 RepID=A0A9P4J980_9PEZI|nr:hypothetical protein K461DRAFT_309726 [Myriangium duriaei CBS 260.36]